MCLARDKGNFLDSLSIMVRFALEIILISSDIN